MRQIRFFIILLSAMFVWGHILQKELSDTTLIVFVGGAIVAVMD